MYKVNEIFYSLQGEGRRAGEPSVFIRFSGCNMKCRLETAADSPGGFDCDTEFTSGRGMPLEELLREVLNAHPRCRWVVLTGGEPLLQVDAPLLQGLAAKGYKVALETNGSLPVPEGVDWVTLSPKVAEHAVKPERVDELKYVRAYGQGIPKPAASALHRYISPAFSGGDLTSKTLEWCLKLCLDNPEWALSVQNHKLWGVR